MSNNAVSLDELERLTDEHWNRNDTEWYIRNLLGHEMANAQQQLEKCDTLVLLVGFSPDPLLQTIWKYRPQRIVLVLNHMYGDQQGKRRADEYVDWIGLMVSMGYCPLPASERLNTATTKHEDIAVATTEAQPDWVFRELRNRLLPDQRAGKRIVVDITGAKKNMASGAFLFAAYASAEISYVDFECYRPEKRRPLGYTCRIGTQPNPYRILGLRDWERVQKLYEQFAFDSAAVEVKRILKGMDAGLADAAGSGAYFSDEQHQTVARLGKVLSVLDQWDNGDYTVAWEQWQATEKGDDTSLQSQMPNFPLPKALTFLGSRAWPSAMGMGTEPCKFLKQHRDLKRGTTKPEDSIFNRPDLLLTYAYDELEKIERLIRHQNDYRSALLRSAGLDELLLKARVATLWLTDKLLIDSNLRTDLPNEKERFDKIADFSGADGLRAFLRDPARVLDVGRGGFKLKRRDPSAHEMAEYWVTPEHAIEHKRIDHKTMVELRGEAIHTHLSIPISYAQDACHIADHALKDFIDNWVMLLEKPIPTFQTWQLTWSDLCTECKLNFLPMLPTAKERVS